MNLENLIEIQINVHYVHIVGHVHLWKIKVFVPYVRVHPYAKVNF